MAALALCILEGKEDHILSVHLYSLAKQWRVIIRKKKETGYTWVLTLAKELKNSQEK